VADKRPAIEKQEAFLEYKQTSTGQQIDVNVLRLRQVTKEKRLEIKNVTESLNSVKAQIDKLKSRLDRKEAERRQRLK
jgi:flagellar capping protein FliD